MVEIRLRFVCGVVVLSCLLTSWRLPKTLTWINWSFLVCARINLAVVLVPQAVINKRVTVFIVDGSYTSITLFHETYIEWEALKAQLCGAHYYQAIINNQWLLTKTFLSLPWRTILPQVSDLNLINLNDICCVYSCSSVCPFPDFASFLDKISWQFISPVPLCCC